MPHQAAAAITAWLGAHPGKPNSHAPIEASAIGPCVAGLQADAVGLYYSGLVSFTDALVGLHSASFAWSTVKLYYSAFYAVRSLLASNGIAIFYGSKTPYSFRLAVGQAPRKEGGVTHKVTWAVLARELANHPLLGEIVGYPAHEWLTWLRETANYRESKFCDPHAPAHFNFIESIGIRSALAQYIADRSMLYTFDADHAAVAFPFECLRRARQSLDRIGRSLDEPDVQHLSTSAARIELADLLPDGV